MEHTLRQILDKLDKMEANMTTKQELEEIKANMVTKQELAEIKAELEKVKANMATKQELQEVKANMATKQDFTLVQQAVLETNEIVKRLETKIDSHEKLLTLLSHRSLEHEAAISSIRFILTK
ncbi:hypothetical protein [Anoxybacillus ayderensis]|uniref:hypothetical protein n=1 Tax=Anoxybacillus ayderensis TaxID=265546 RepID=UPI000A2709E1|nr:hypothetical protein [Anoxybacillus ayderensis]MED0656970.1 hypothetical protein [Anoxybacillus ayderensis]OSX54526.1 hypothetical protein B7H16_05725 [Anoxybacillus ayderensis]